MWPLERKADVVRVGRDRVEYWASAAQGLILHCAQALDCADGPRASALAPALGRLLQTLRAGSARSAASSINVVFESAWLPIMHLEIGDSLWLRKLIEALLRHRFEQLYNNRDDPVSAWDLQLDHRPGDVRALGYGFAPSIKQAAIGAVAAAGLRLASLQPAFAWGWQRMKPHRARFEAAADRRGGWWVWVEQDRALVGHVDARGRLNALNPAAAVPGDAAQAMRLIEIEALRHGLPAQATHGVVVDWRLAPNLQRGGAGDRVAWVSVAATGAVAAFPAVAPEPAGVST